MITAPNANFCSVFSVAPPAEPRGEKKTFFVQILGGEKLLKMLGELLPQKMFRVRKAPNLGLGRLRWPSDSRSDSEQRKSRARKKGSLRKGSFQWKNL